MNDKLLLQKRINFPKDEKHIRFLNFIHPGYEIVNNINDYDNPTPSGIIYVGQYEDNIVERLNRITSNWIIVNEHHNDVDLSTNDGLIKNLLPLHYVQLKNSKLDDINVYHKMEYDVLLEKIKYCLINNSLQTDDNSTDTSVYNLFAAILGTPDVLNREFFNIVSKKNVSLVTSSLLTFLNKVQSQNIKGASVHYARLITQSNQRYGKRIKQAVCKFVKSKANKEVALYNLLSDLNKTR